jgi:O-acetyl-ADP-ribose deacetylase (regulator of RNase III)
MPPLRLQIERGDLTRCADDAIVNAANPTLLGGGGVDAAIHRAAGPRLLERCRRLPENGGVRCPTGEARITPGFDLPAQHVIHAVGPIFDADPDPDAMLIAAHRNSLALANANGLKSIAFPAISCGVYGFPPEAAAPIAIQAALTHAGGLVVIRFVLFNPSLFETWKQALKSVKKP